MAGGVPECLGAQKMSAAVVQVCQAVCDAAACRAGFSQQVSRTKLYRNVADGDSNTSNWCALLHQQGQQLTSLPFGSSNVCSCKRQSPSSGRNKSHFPPSTSATTTFLARLFDSDVAISRGVVTPRTADFSLPSGKVTLIGSFRCCA